MAFEFSEWQKVFLNLATVVAWAMGIVISIVAVAKGKKMKEEMGVSFRTYLILVGITEVFYTIGAVMILSAMGINVMRHLANLELWKFYQIVSRLDLATIRIIGVIGWIGFIINRFISFLSPAYLLVCGGKRLSKYFFYSAWTEVILELMTTFLVAVSLKMG